MYWLIIPSVLTAAFAYIIYVVMTSDLYIDEWKGVDVDKESILQQVQNMYNEGIRSYVDSEGDVLHQDKDGNQWEPGYLETWKVLRAYQDEQRKKGEPIVFTDWDAENRWLNRDHGEIGVYRSSFAVRQEWDQTKRPRIYAFDREHCSAIFTNFRWRPGHGPKGGDHGQAG